MYCLCMPPIIGAAEGESVPLSTTSWNAPRLVSELAVRNGGRHASQRQWQLSWRAGVSAGTAARRVAKTQLCAPSRYSLECGFFSAEPSSPIATSSTAKRAWVGGAVYDRRRAEQSRGHWMLRRHGEHQPITTEIDDETAGGDCVALHLMAGLLRRIDGLTATIECMVLGGVVRSARLHDDARACVSACQVKSLRQRSAYCTSGKCHLLMNPARPWLRHATAMTCHDLVRSDGRSSTLFTRACPQSVATKPPSSSTRLLPHAAALDLPAGPSLSITAL
ncbi:hypothetical protein P153DRAFT_393335 [Dothidotthia symphoricarpi CBS 119687]|uniref:Uncharacterized protein n=1 Tax=Dothidotthia symphoricarpi CBS 119687 TaxID=1392245 RepID=A0A6A6AP00_9PLEO|nr:uncharacterized protein P153DRAFT_393335 [Dothidotthia symphoricarpi CBS 119687]KAF2133520.1 hypothetical protein P153DRAFT_393335 [Dothidotthia symphoricarpi CBS 119687]